MARKLAHAVEVEQLEDHKSGPITHYYDSEQRASAVVDRAKRLLLSKSSTEKIGPGEYKDDYEKVVRTYPTTVRGNFAFRK